MDELTEITDYIEMKAGLDADVIFGQGLDVSLGESLRVTVIATGFATKEIGSEVKRRTVYDLDSAKEIPQAQQEAKQPEPTRFTFAPQQPQPTALRKKRHQSQKIIRIKWCIPLILINQKSHKKKSDQLRRTIILMHHYFN